MKGYVKKFNYLYLFFRFACTNSITKLPLKVNPFSKLIYASLTP